VDEEVLVAGSKHKAAAELKRIFAQAMLFMTRSLCPFAGLQIVFAQKVEQGSVAQADSLIGFALVIDQERKLDAGSLAEEPGVAGVAQSDDSQTCAFALELGFKFAQLRDVLSAKDSTVMTKKDHHGRPSLPQGTQPSRLAIGVRQRNSGQLAAECFSHAGHSLGGRASCQAAFVEVAGARILRMVIADFQI
jgi:hypothetical protein